MRLKQSVECDLDASGDRKIQYLQSDPGDCTARCAKYDLASDPCTPRFAGFYPGTCAHVPVFFETLSIVENSVEIWRRRIAEVFQSVTHLT
jgi:hypothetical protein